MGKKTNRAEFKDYLITVLRTVPPVATDLYYETAAKMIFNMAKRVFTEEEEQTVSEDDINEVYAAYPSKCVITGRTLGKSSSDKRKIERLLRDKTKEQLVKTIQRYVEDCKRDKVYMKNFSTFLNNLPDYDMSEKPKPVEIGGYRDMRKIYEAQ